MLHRSGKDGEVVYIYYTLHKDATGTVVLAELKLTTYPNKWKIDFFSSTEKAIFALVKEKALKEAPIALRSYDEATNIWTYMENWGPKIIERAKALCSVLGGINTIEVENLSAIATAQYFDPKKLKLPPKPEDFFYNPTGNAATSSALTKESACVKLASLLEVSEAILSSAASGELKKLYRRAALKYHPDRNNGDGSKMSELNMLWGVWNA